MIDLGPSDKRHFLVYTGTYYLFIKNEPTLINYSGKSPPPRAVSMDPVPVVHIQETRVEVEESGCVRATRADVESAPDEVDRGGADGASRKSSKDEL